jgi:IstB-like ATP binding protein
VTIYAWRKRYGQLESVDVKRLRYLEQENGKLKKLVAERDLEIEVMKEVAAKGMVGAPVRRRRVAYLRYRDKLAKPDLVILDDMGMRKLSATEAQDLCELLEERSINKSAFFTTQLPLDHWSEVIGAYSSDRER